MSCFRALPFRHRCSLLQPVRDGVLRVGPPPRCLCPCPALALAFLRRARPLSLPDPWVRPEPLPTNPAWPFLEPRAHRGHAHRNPPASPPPPPPIRSRVDYFRRADPGSFSRAAKPQQGAAARLPSRSQSDVLPFAGPSQQAPAGRDLPWPCPLYGGHNSTGPMFVRMWASKPTRLTWPRDEVDQMLVFRHLPALSAWTRAGMFHLPSFSEG